MGESDQVLLRMTGINKQFPGVRALENVDLEVGRGEVHGLVGQNGAGKTTLVNVLFGLLRPDSGSIHFDGAQIGDMSPALAKQLGISIVPQIIQNQPYLSVAENMFIGDWPLKERGSIDWERMYGEAQEMFERMGLDVEARDRMERLSIGQQQMVEIARALRLNAKLIVLDEPTPPLTNVEVQKLYDLVRSLKKGGVTFIYISHYLQEIFDLCDRVTVMRDGRVRTSCAVSSLDIAECIRHMVGRDVNLFPDREPCIRKEDALVVRGLTTPYLEGISFTVKKGEIVGLAGLTGSGRTEVAKAIYGLDPMTSGEIWVGGQPVEIHSPRDALGCGIAYLPEDRRGEGTVVIRSVKENISLSSLSKIASRLGFIKHRPERALAQKWVDSLGVRTPSLDQLVALLSGGNQQKVVLGRLLATEAKVLILDEPTIGIDVGAKAEIHRLMNELAEQGQGLILISSDAPELLAMSDRILVLHRGRIYGELSGEEATEHNLLMYAEGHGREMQAEPMVDQLRPADKLHSEERV